MEVMRLHAPATLGERALEEETGARTATVVSVHGGTDSVQYTWRRYMEILHTDCAHTYCMQIVYIYVAYTLIGGRRYTGTFGCRNLPPRGRIRKGETNAGWPPF